MDIDLLAALCEAPGAPGREERIRDLVIREMGPYVDDLTVDPMGSVAGTRRGGGGPRVLLAAHMDELGFLVTHIDDEGFIRVVPLGGFDPKTKVAQRVIVHGTEDLLGVMGAKPIHIMSEEERKRLPKPDDHYIDVGLPADRVRAIVRQGDPVTRERTLARLGDLVTCKSLDNRAGLYVMLRALRQLAEHECEVVAVATTQEEVGLRGARVAAQRLRPDIGLAIDITLANDGPGAKPHERVTVVGAGAAIKAYDSGVIVPRAVIDHLVGIADSRGIAHQIEIMPRGGTDTRELQLAGDGALAGCVSIPTRYVHQVVETCHPDDLEACAALVAGFCETAQDLL
ncbi:MAG: M20/M25/M40 family metallo-hydrolase [Thermoleophilia bacterium]|nr:M20/M25/M40 family metallo-hydrolase [Thermoleophilia bacterium]